MCIKYNKLLSRKHSFIPTNITNYNVQENQIDRLSF
jgi:hypothetical protein